MEKKVYLLANAHIDPIWQWTLDEGIAASLSTFESACNLLDTHDFVFCHNESLLYEWIEENDHELFGRISGHIASGKWKIMGGWYLQPDCNLARGESYVRQIAEGRKYFKEKFGICPNVAVNLDSFGHSRGLVQILKKTGFDGYLFCRPYGAELNLPADEFVWVGLDGSKIKAVRAGAYNSKLGKVDEKIAGELQRQSGKENALILWGVGNHGGGPSAADLNIIAALQAEGKAEYIHSSPEEFFDAFTESAPVYEQSLNSCMPGCYISESRLKRIFRTAENLYYQTERMCMAAAKQGFDASETLHSALKKIMLAMFHDTLPGSCIRDAEVQTVQTLGGVISDLEDLRLKAMRRLVSGLEPTRPDVYSVLAYNPLPYAVEGVFECEFMLSDQDYSENYHEIEVEENGKKIPSQAIKERSNIPIEWRKRVAFHARLEPFSAHKFECTERLVQKIPRDVCESCKTEWRGGNVSVKFGKNGALESLKLGEKEYLGGEIKLSVYGDTEDSWGMRLECLERLGDFERDFELMNKSECSEWTGGQDVSSPVRITEDGEVFTRVETLLVCNRSAAVLTWTLYKFCDYVDLQVRIYNNEKNKLLKLRVPVAASEYIRQIPFGCEPITEGGAENAMLGYCAATGENGTFLICNDGVFSASCENGEIALSLLRSVPYTAHPIGDRKVVPYDRFSPRMDQGEHVYSFRFIPDCNLRLASRRAQEFSEPPYVLNMSVSKRTGDKPDSPFKLSEGGAVVVAMRAENDGYLVRLANECGEEQVQTITAGNLNSVLRFKSFEVKTVRIGKTIRECEQMEW